MFVPVLCSSLPSAKTSLLSNYRHQHFAVRPKGRGWFPVNSAYEEKFFLILKDDVKHINSCMVYPSTSSYKRSSKQVEKTNKFSDDQCLLNVGVRTLS